MTISLKCGVCGTDPYKYFKSIKIGHLEHLGI